PLEPAALVTFVTTLRGKTPVITTKFELLDPDHFTAAADSDGSPVSKCKISCEGPPPAITYFEEAFHIWASSTVTLLPTPDGARPRLPYSPDPDESPPEPLTAQGAADYLWELFLRRVRQRL